MKLERCFFFMKTKNNINIQHIFALSIICHHHHQMYDIRKNVSRQIYLTGNVIN